MYKNGKICIRIITTEQTYSKRKENNKRENIQKNIK